MIPTPLSESADANSTSPAAVLALQRLTTFVVENAKSARATLKRYAYPRPIAEAKLLILNEHSDANDLRAALAPLLAGEDVGLMSEAGCPAVADPGADLVRKAHEHGIRVVPLVGPSAILLALMASGLNGQRFRFCGYLPAERAARADAIRALEMRSRAEDETQVFIETPYRGKAMFEALLASCQPSTSLCIASDLTGAREQIITHSIKAWLARPAPSLEDPTVFLLAAR